MKMIKQDWAMAASICFSYGALILTRYYLGILNTFAETAEQVASIAKVIEANPLQAQLFAIGGVMEMVQIVLMPAVFIGTYAFLRHWHLKNNQHSGLWLIVIFFLISTSRDFVGNLAFIIGKLAGI